MTLSRKQTELLQFLQDSLDENGEVAISLREIGARMGWDTPNAAQNIVNALLLKGYIKRLPPKFSREPNVYQIIRRD